MQQRHETADDVLYVISDEYLKAPYSTLERNAALWQAASRRGPGDRHTPPPARRKQTAWARQARGRWTVAKHRAPEGRETQSSDLTRCPPSKLHDDSLLPRD